MDRRTLREITGLTDPRGRVFVVSGPSGVGKDCVLDGLLSHPLRLPGLCRVVTATTRSPRPGECDGRDYVFLSQEEFMRRRSAGWFFETAQFGSNWYGTPRDALDAVCTSGSDAVLKIETQGAAAAKAQIPDAVLIFICPPSLDALAARLSNRATETVEALQERISQARVELERAAHYDYVIVNDDLAEAVDALRAIILAERHRVARSSLESGTRDGAAIGAAKE